MPMLQSQNYHYCWASCSYIFSGNYFCHHICDKFFHMPDRFLENGLFHNVNILVMFVGCLFQYFCLDFVGYHPRYHNLRFHYVSQSSAALQMSIALCTCQNTSSTVGLHWYRNAGRRRRKNVNVCLHFSAHSPLLCSRW